MFSQLQIVRMAKMVICLHGADAGKYADKRMRHYMKIDDVKAAADWFAIGHEIAMQTGVTRGQRTISVLVGDGPVIH